MSQNLIARPGASSGLWITAPLPGQRQCQRLQGRYANLRVIHGPICQLAQPDRDLLLDYSEKVLTPNDFSSLEMLAERLERFERHYEIIAQPLNGSSHVMI